MKTLIAFTLVFGSALAHSSEIKILAWYKLESQSSSNTTAEVCFSVTPKPTAPLFANITVDKGSRSEGNYTSWVGTKGSTCHVVATRRGRVEVSIPSTKSIANKSL